MNINILIFVCVVSGANVSCLCFDKLLFPLRQSNKEMNERNINMGDVGKGEPHNILVYLSFNLYPIKSMQNLTKHNFLSELVDYMHSFANSMFIMSNALYLKNITHNRLCSPTQFHTRSPGQLL